MVSINSFTCLLVNSSTNQTTCLHMNICAYHNARRASAYKWFFIIFFYNQQSVGGETKSESKASSA